MMSSPISLIKSVRLMFQWSSEAFTWLPRAATAPSENWRLRSGFRFSLL